MVCGARSSDDSGLVENPPPCCDVIMMPDVKKPGSVTAWVVAVERVAEGAGDLGGSLGSFTAGCDPLTGGLMPKQWVRESMKVSEQVGRKAMSTTIGPTVAQSRETVGNLDPRAGKVVNDNSRVPSD